MNKQKQDKKPETVVFDGAGAILGRLCTRCAKLALQGSEVVVVNVENAFISGGSEHIISRYAARRHMTQKANPENAAKWPRRPDYFFKAVMRGMVPKHSARGKNALSRIIAHIGVPAGIDVSKALKVKNKDKLGSNGISILELCHKLGWNK